MTSYATPRSPLRHIATPPLTSPTSARRHKEEVEELRTLQKKNSELRRAEVGDVKGGVAMWRRGLRGVA